MFRSFVRGVLWISLFYLLFDNFSDHYSRTFLLLMLTILMMLTIKKRKKDGASPGAQELTPIPKQIYRLQEDGYKLLPVKDLEQIATTIAISAALGNLYSAEGQIKLRITNSYGSKSQSENFEYIGRVNPHNLDISRSSFPFDVYREICEEQNHGVDLDFLKIIKDFGWIGLEMGNLPPLSLQVIDRACPTPEDRKIIAGKINSYVIGYAESKDVIKIWNSQCLWLAKLIQSEEGMSAIRTSEPYWLPYFNY
jgi:hypothetical protein